MHAFLVRRLGVLRVFFFLVLPLKDGWCMAEAAPLYARDAGERIDVFLSPCWKFLRTVPIPMSGTTDVFFSFRTCCTINSPHDFFH